MTKQELDERVSRILQSAEQGWGEEGHLRSLLEEFALECVGPNKYVKDVPVEVTMAINLEKELARSSMKELLS